MWTTYGLALPRTLGTMSLVVPPSDICLCLWLYLHTAAVLVSCQPKTQDSVHGCSWSGQ